MLRYCRACVMPSTKPDLAFNEDGICSACVYYARRPEIDWQARREEFLTIVDRYRAKNDTVWDAIVPISGGKDSTFQVIKLLEMGLNPLGVVATTCHLSEIGRKNIQNIRELGVDIYEVSSNPVVRRKLNRIGLEQVGDISWPEHCSIFTIPVRVAVETGVRLIVWGENPQHEYGGPATNAHSPFLTRRWLEEFGGLLGLRVSDLVGIEGIRERDLILYSYPSEEILQAARVTGVFLGHYFPWDGFANAEIAKQHGFSTFSRLVEGSIVDYENLDNCQTGIHDYFKFLKFGFGRATDLACLHVRRGRMTREEALRLVREHDGKFPWTYLGVSLEAVLTPLGMSVEQFISICDRFTNRQLFVRDPSGIPVKDADGNLTKVNYDNECS